MLETKKPYSPPSIVIYGDLTSITRAADITGPCDGADFTIHILHHTGTGGICVELGH